MTNLIAWLRLPLVVLGVALLFVADRYLSVESYHAVLRMVAMLLVGLGCAASLFLAANAQKREHRAEARGWVYGALWQVGLLAALALYLIYAKVIGNAGGPQTPIAKVLLGAWLTVFCLSLFAAAGIEWALRESGRGHFAEPRRVARSGLAWLAVGMLLAFLASLNYVGDRKDITTDWSYLKIRTPSEATLNMIRTLTQPMTIALFYPQGNEVRTLVADYFSAIASQESRIKIEWYDKDMHPTQAEDYRVARNGQIVFDLNGKRSRIDTGTVLSKARKTLKELDSEFQKGFLEITQNKKTLYFARGHGESSWVGDSGDNPLKSLRLLENFLRQQNYSPRLFGIAEGSATAVPDDAAAVVIVGPSSPYQKDEIEALRRYVQGGGNLLVFLDVEKASGDTENVMIGADAGQPLIAFLQEMGIRYTDVPLANDKNHISATRSPSDSWFIFTNAFTSHDSVVSLARHDERVAILMFQAGYLAVTPELGQWRAFETVRTLSDSFADIDRDFGFTKDKEKRDAYVVGAVAEYKGLQKDGNGDKSPTQKNGRVVVFTDATAISDALVRNIGNALYFSDTLKWAVGESQLAGALADEEDVKIRHTRNEDVVWFHSTVVLVPLLVLGVGWLATRRAKGRGDNARETHGKGSGNDAA